MKILVLSDSHSGLRFMRDSIEILRPDAMIHLGDYFDDAKAISEDYPHIPLIQVPGNCDRFRYMPNQPEILIQNVYGAELYLTHGHRHNVKMTTGLLLRDARAAKVDAVLYGHTHVADCHQEPDGLWVLNPGSCGYSGGSVGLMVVENRKIKNCRILRQSDLEDML